MQIDGINPFNPSQKTVSGLNTKEFDALAQQLATKFGISQYTAFSVLRKFTGNVESFNELQEFVSKFLNETQTATIEDLSQDLKSIDQNPRTNNDTKIDSSVERLRYGILQSKQSININNQKQLEADRFVGSNQAKVSPQSFIMLSELVQRPRLFASWLVNNKAAFINLKAYPEVTNLVLALQNPMLAKSPVLLSQIAMLITQLLKIKAGKSNQTDELSEIRKEESDKQYALDAADHKAAIVDTVKKVAETQKPESLRDFLLEAERFAEEEIANLWSLTLKKEKELETKLKERFKKFIKDRR